MKYRVIMIADAEEDLIDIYRYVARKSSVERAEQLLSRLEETCRRLDQLPVRGQVPPELERIAVLEFREMIVRPYRILYEVVDDEVYVHAVLDGRRDLQDLLQRRLLR